jgi:AcrR family transcriptional regulator
VAPRSRETSEQMRAQSRQRILAAARGLFAERSFFACKVADIAARSGMSAGNVYWHFPTKEAILQAILAEGFDALETMTAEVAEEYGPARRKLDLLVDHTIALYIRHGDFAIILAGLMGPGGQELIRSLGFDMGEIRGRYHANLRRVFAEARVEAAIAPADPELLVAFYLSFFDGLLITYRDLWPTLGHEVVRDAALRIAGYRPVG